MPRRPSASFVPLEHTKRGLGPVGLENFQPLRRIWAVILEPGLRDPPPAAGRPRASAHVLAGAATGLSQVPASSWTTRMRLS